MAQENQKDDQMKQGAAASSPITPRTVNEEAEGTGAAASAYGGPTDEAEDVYETSTVAGEQDSSATDTSSTDSAADTDKGGR